MSLHHLKDLFVQELRELYDAENQLLRALPRMAHAVRNEELRVVLQDHRREVQKHLERLERAFSKLRLGEGGGNSEGMRAMIRSCERLLRMDGKDAIRDAAVIAAVQRIGHYQIAGYGAARTFADTLECEDFAWILTECLEDERETDQRLSRLAESALNFEAADATKLGR